MHRESNKLNNNIKTENFPNPIFRRDNTKLLDGSWKFQFDGQDVGIEEKWYINFPEVETRINVPYVYQCLKSGVNVPDEHNNADHDIVWYHKEVNINKFDIEIDTVLLHFGASDYETSIYVNGNFIGTHIGGFTPFSFDISKFVEVGINKLTVRVKDYRYKEDILRGKQFWEDIPKSIWYTPSTGIWQSVWLEKTSKQHVQNFFITSVLETGSLNFEISLRGVKEDVTLTVEIYDKSELIVRQNITAQSEMSFSVDVLGNKIFNYNYHESGLVWSPNNPKLLDINIILHDSHENILDCVRTYSAMRKVHYDNGVFYLNNRPFFQRLVLDQGYWPESLMTGTSIEHKKDIELAKELGFNGARKHEKLESPHYYYWADKLGFLVWAEMPSAIMYSSQMVVQATKEWYEAIRSRYNHPSIVAWVPLNESWGVSNIYRDQRQLNHSQSMYHFIKSIDMSRLVVNNDGWELNKSDVVAVHNYMHGDENNKAIRNSYRKMFDSKKYFFNTFPASRNIILEGFEKELYDKPIMLTEFGGISYTNDQNSGWGYSQVTNEESYIEELLEIFKIVTRSEFIQGYCYTQLYDVEQEINGLLTYDRGYKVDVEKLKQINGFDKTIMKSGWNDEYEN